MRQEDSRMKNVYSHYENIVIKQYKVWSNVGKVESCEPSHSFLH